jgi:quercetin dioxygenase-like cupin family protein
MKKLLFLLLTICLYSFAKAQYNNDLIIEQILKTDTTSIGQKIEYSNFENNEATILKITIPAGKSTGWHKHSFPVFAYVLEGTLSVEIENQKNKQFTKNSSFSEVINTFHNGINLGTENVVLIAFFMGEKGKALSIHK